MISNTDQRKGYFVTENKKDGISQSLDSVAFHVENIPPLNNDISVNYDKLYNLSRQSHQKVSATCQFQLSHKCTKNIELEYRTLIDNCDRNNGKYICLFCSRQLKYSGRNNPNSKYLINDNLFENIDCEHKAYILGFLASDGSFSQSSGTTTIKIHKKDIVCLQSMRDYICKNLPIKYDKKGMVKLTISSTKIRDDCCKHLKINPGKKSYIIRFPDLTSDELKWCFLRGYFDGDGGINTYNNKKRYPSCDIYSSSIEMLKDISNFVSIPHSISKQRIYWSGNNCIDFLGKLYDNATISMSRKRNLYYMWSTWEPSLSGPKSYYNIDSIKFSKTRKDAVFPFKSRASDSGYDLTILEKVKEVGNLQIFSTGIKISPPYGYYFDMVPRSSIIKYGYMLANSIGIIDRQYVGEILVALNKVDYSKPDPELPARLVQIIPRKIQHFPIIEVDNIEDTERSSNGFGSSGN